MIFPRACLATLLLWPALAAGQTQHDPDWYKTHWEPHWSGGGSLGGLSDSNIGTTSSQASAASDGGIYGYLGYGIVFNAPRDPGARGGGLGYLKIAGYLDGEYYIGYPHASRLSPGLRAEWEEPRLPGLGSVGVYPDLEVFLQYDHYGANERDNLFPFATLRLERSWWVGPEFHVKEGLPDQLQLRLWLDGGLGQHNATSGDGATQKVFTGSSGWVGAGAYLFRQTRARFFNGISLHYAYQTGDLVSTGPATPDVVAAAIASTPDTFLDTGSGPSGYKSYRLSAQTTRLRAQLELLGRLSFSWTHSTSTGSAGFTAADDDYRLWFPFSF